MVSRPEVLTLRKTQGGEGAGSGVQRWASRHRWREGREKRVGRRGSARPLAAAGRRIPFFPPAWEPPAHQPRLKNSHRRSLIRRAGTDRLFEDYEVVNHGTYGNGH